jgi:hypothetical protein
LAFKPEPETEPELFDPEPEVEVVLDQVPLAFASVPRARTYRGNRAARRKVSGVAICVAECRM